MPCGIMVIVIGNGLSVQSSKPGQGPWISDGANTLEKDMNPTILLPAMGKY